MDIGGDWKTRGLGDGVKNSEPGVEPRAAETTSTSAIGLIKRCLKYELYRQVSGLFR
jgi:hypothetical protein